MSLMCHLLQYCNVNLYVIERRQTMQYTAAHLRKIGKTMKNIFYFQVNPGV